MRKPCVSLAENQKLENQLETLRGLGRVDIQDADQGRLDQQMSLQILVTVNRGILLKGQHPLPRESG